MTPRAPHPLEARFRDFIVPGVVPERPRFDDPFPGTSGIPRIAREAFSGPLLGGALAHHGCLLVEGLLDTDATRELVETVDRASAAAKRFHALEDKSSWEDPWYDPFPLPRGDFIDDVGRKFAATDGVWAADCPPGFDILTRAFDRAGVSAAIDTCLGEPGFLSVGKTTLRRIAPTAPPNGWHQDGAFLGEGIRTVNCWIALTDCGVDSPGLDIVPIRSPGLFERGTRGTFFPWGVGTGVVGDVCKEYGVNVVSPVFRAGDAVFFDQLLLHCTGVRPGMTRERYAIEAWHFGASTFPMRQVPLAR